MALPNPGMDFTPFDVLTAAELDDLVENIEALAAGTGLNDNSIAARSLSTSAIFLGQTSVGGAFTTSSGSDVLVTGSPLTVTVPTGGRKVLIMFNSSSIWNNSGGLSHFKVWRGTVGSGTLLSDWVQNMPSGNSIPVTLFAAPDTPSAGSVTYNLSASSNSGVTHTDSVHLVALLV